MLSSNSAHNRLRVLVVDDSALYRKVVSEVLSEIPGIEVVGIAANGKIALDRIEQLSPDLITLDLEMPVIDGHGVLRELRIRQSDTAAIILSSFSEEGARATTQALEAGAFDFVLKPTGTDSEQSKHELRQVLANKLDAFRHSQSSARPATRSVSRSSPALPSKTASAKPLAAARGPRPDIVAIGISTGGPAALGKLIPRLPRHLPVPVVIVQHMPPVFTASLAEELNKSSALEVREGSHGQSLHPGTVTIAPGGKQMKVERNGLLAKIVVTDDPPERSCRPSVDYMFRSLAHHYDANVLAIIMTGMGDDGLLGCKLLHRNGATILAQDEQTSVVYGMPRQIAEHGLAHAECSLEELAPKIKQLLELEATPCR